MTNTIIEAHYRANKARLVKVVMRRVGKDPHLAEEAVQEAYTRALIYFHCYNPKKSFDGWFITILNNSVKDLMAVERHRGLVLEDSDGVEDTTNSISGSFGVDLTIWQQNVSQMINLVKNNLHKEVLTLYITKGASYKAIVMLTEAPSEAMVRKVVSRFKESLL